VTNFRFYLSTTLTSRCSTVRAVPLVPIVPNVPIDGQSVGNISVVA
jgi:hypothetical protein